MKLCCGQYYGHITQQITLDHFLVTKTIYPPTIKVPLHFHDNPYVCFVVKGHYKEITGKSEIECSPGETIVHPSRYEHQNMFWDQPTTCLNIEFDQSRGNFKKGFYDSLAITKIKQPYLAKIFYRILHEVKFYDAHSPLMIEGLIMEMVAETARNEDRRYRHTRWARKIMDILQEQYQEPLQLVQLASKVELNPSYLSREFKNITGKTLSEYLQIIRIERSKLLLKTSDESIISISLQCGFSDQSHFTRNFKKITGLSPLKFRKEKSIVNIVQKVNTAQVLF